MIKKIIKAPYSFSIREHFLVYVFIFFFPLLEYKLCKLV